MQTDRDALLAGIVADPDADLPRLVFADWLEETGHPANCARAEYIRLAIEREFFTENDAKLRRTRHRLTTLRKMFDDEWDGYFRGLWPPRGTVKAHRSRGFVDRVSVDESWLPAVLPELTLRHPVRGLQIYGSESIHGPSELIPPNTLQSLWLFNFRTLSEGIELLVTSGTLAQLQMLSIRCCRLGDGDGVRLLRRIRANAAMQNLVTLDLSHNEFTDQAAHTLAAADWPPTFRRLDIDGNRISNAGREVLFRRFGFEELRPRLALG